MKFSALNYAIHYCLAEPTQFGLESTHTSFNQFGANYFFFINKAVNPHYTLIKKATHYLLVCGFLVFKLTNQAIILINAFQKTRPSWCGNAKSCLCLHVGCVNG